MATETVSAQAKAKEVDVQVTTDDELPPFYRRGFSNFMQEAQKKDPDFRHYWVHISAKNQHLKLLKGWKPLEDRALLERLGLASLITANGRARWGDLELWRRPERMSQRIQKMHAEDVAARSASARAAMDALAHETKDRSRGAVVPFVGPDPVGTGDLITRKPVAEPDK